MGIDPTTVLAQLRICVAVARFAVSAALHGRCKPATLGGSIWLPLTLICNLREEEWQDADGEFFNTIRAGLTAFS